jgi:hypothetical protein
MTEQPITRPELAAWDAADRHVMVFFRRDGTPNLTMVHVIHPDQTLDFLARFPVQSGEWRAIPAGDMTDIDFTLD